MGAIFMLAGSLFAGFSQNLGQFVGARVFLGIGTAAAREPTGIYEAPMLIPFRDRGRVDDSRIGSSSYPPHRWSSSQHNVLCKLSRSAAPGR